MFFLRHVQRCLRWGELGWEGWYRWNTRFKNVFLWGVSTQNKHEPFMLDWRLVNGYWFVFVLWESNVYNLLNCTISIKISISTVNWKKLKSQGLSDRPPEQADFHKAFYALKSSNNTVKLSVIRKVNISTFLIKCWIFW